MLRWKLHTDRMYEKGQLVFLPEKLSEEDTLFEVSEAERLGQGGGEETVAAPF